MRFPNFEKSWEKTYLSKYLTVSSLRNKDNTYTRNDVLSVSGELGIVNQIELLGRSYAGESLLPYHIVEKDDVVYTKSPLAEYPYGIIKTNRIVPGIVSTLYAVYKSTTSSNNRFVEHYFSLKSRTNNYLKPIVRIGAKHDMKIGNEEVLKNYVVFPAVEEQTKIADFLDLIDERNTTQSKIIDKLKSQMNCIIDNIIDYSAPQVQFKDLYTNAGEGGTPSTSNNLYYENGSIPFIKIEDLSNKYLNENNAFITEQGLKNSSAWIIPANSIIYSNGATIGRISINTYPVCTKQGILGIIPSRIVLTEYLYYFLRSIYFRKQVHRITVKGTMDCAYLKDLNFIKCYIPALERQEKIIKSLRCLDEKILLEETILNKLKEQKKFLLSNMFI